MTTAGELCSRTTVFATEDEPLIDAAQRMREHHVGALVVVRERDGERVAVAIITDRDITIDAVAT